MAKSDVAMLGATAGVAGFFTGAERGIEKGQDIAHRMRQQNRDFFSSMSQVQLGLTQLKERSRQHDEQMDYYYDQLKQLDMSQIADRNLRQRMQTSKHNFERTKYETEREFVSEEAVKQRKSDRQRAYITSGPARELARQSGREEVKKFIVQNVQGSFTDPATGQMMNMEQIEQHMTQDYTGPEEGRAAHFDRKMGGWLAQLTNNARKYNPRIADNIDSELVRNLLQWQAGAKARGEEEFNNKFTLQHGRKLVESTQGYLEAYYDDIDSAAISGFTFGPDLRPEISGMSMPEGSDERKMAEAVKLIFDQAIHGVTPRSGGGAGLDPATVMRSMNQALAAAPDTASYVDNMSQSDKIAMDMYFRGRGVNLPFSQLGTFEREKLYRMFEGGLTSRADFEAAGVPVTGVSNEERFRSNTNQRTPQAATRQSIGNNMVAAQKTYNVSRKAAFTGLTGIIKNMPKGVLSGKISGDDRLMLAKDPAVRAAAVKKAWSTSRNVFGSESGDDRFKTLRQTGGTMEYSGATRTMGDALLSNYDGEYYTQSEAIVRMDELYSPIVDEAKVVSGRKQNFSEAKRKWDRAEGKDVIVTGEHFKASDFKGNDGVTYITGTSVRQPAIPAVPYAPASSDEEYYQITDAAIVPPSLKDRPSTDDYSYKTATDTARQINSAMRMNHDEFTKWVGKRVSGSRGVQTVSPFGAIMQMENIISGPEGIQNLGDTITPEAKADAMKRLSIISEVLGLDQGILTGMAKKAEVAGAFKLGAGDVTIEQALLDETPEGDITIESEEPAVLSETPEGEILIKPEMTMDDKYKEYTKFLDVLIDEHKSGKRDTRSLVAETKSNIPQRDRGWLVPLAQEYISEKMDAGIPGLSESDLDSMMSGSAGEKSPSEIPQFLGEGQVERPLEDAISASDLKSLMADKPLEGAVSISDLKSLMADKELDDTVSLSDLKSLMADKPLDDSVSASDLKSLMADKPLGDTISAGDLKGVIEGSAGEGEVTDTTGFDPTTVEPTPVSEYADPRTGELPEGIKFNRETGETYSEGRNLEDLPGMKAAVKKAGLVLGKASLDELMGDKAIKKILEKEKGWTYSGPPSTSVDAVKREINMVGELTENIIKAIDTIISYDQGKISLSEYKGMLKSTKFKELADYPPDKLDYIRRKLIEAETEEVASSERGGRAKG